jgi:predicted nucleic acid-binding protein
LRIYADTSFLVSYLYYADTGHATARALFAKHAADDWVTSEWSRFETINSLRQVVRGGWKAPHAEATIRLFKHWHRTGPFEAASPGLDAAMPECQQLSAAHGTISTMRAADVLHVALLDQLRPDLFVTRDQDQFTLAQTTGWSALFVR